MNDLKRMSDIKHQMDREFTYSFPEYELLPFKVKDLNEDEMAFTLYSLEDSREYDSIKNVIKYEKEYRNENSITS